MDGLTDGDLFRDAVDAVIADVLSQIGDDADARYAFFERLVEPAQQIVEASVRRSSTPNRRQKLF